MPPTNLNALALKLKALHIPGKPLLLANVHDAHTANIVASHTSCLAIATASWSIAATQGIADDDMTLSQNLQGIATVIRGVANAGKTATLPITADLQSGYTDIQSTIRQAISLGCVGANIEDIEVHPDGTLSLRSLTQSTTRIRLALQAAADAAVPDFVINARTDILGHGGTIDDVILRGRAFLDAGATTVFVWGVRKHELTVEEVRRMCEALGGRVATQGPGPTGMSVRELRDVGVSRISMGPWIFRKAMDGFGELAGEMMAS